MQELMAQRGAVSYWGSWWKVEAATAMSSSLDWLLYTICPLGKSAKCWATKSSRRRLYLSTIYIHNLKLICRDVNPEKGVKCECCLRWLGVARWFAMLNYREISEPPPQTNLYILNCIFGQYWYCDRTGKQLHEYIMHSLLIGIKCSE